MRFKGFYFLISSIFLHSIGYSQNDNQVNSRNAIFDRLEARAKSLASRMDEMAGNANTEQTGVNSPIPSSSVPLFNQEQEARSEEPSIPNPSNGSPTETSISPNSAFTVVDNSEDFLPPPTVQELKGDYYILPTLGFALSSESTVKLKRDGSIEEKYLDNKMGYSIGVRAGMRFNDFYSDVGIKYSSIEFNTHGALRGTPYIGEGSLDILNFNARLGYTFQLMDSLALNGSVGLGFANRKNILQDNIKRPSTFTSNENVLSYDLAFSLSYDLADNFMVILGYNYVNVAEISQFSELNMHIFELGAVANF